MVVTAVAAEVRHPTDNDLGLTPNCVGTDPEAWFFQKGSNSHSRAFQTLQRICNECPLKDQCLEWAIRHEKSGIWAGTTVEDRERIRAERGIWCDAPEVDVLVAYFARSYPEEGVRLDPSWEPYR